MSHTEENVIRAIFCPVDCSTFLRVQVKRPRAVYGGVHTKFQHHCMQAQVVTIVMTFSVTRKKLQKVYKSCPKMIWIEKLKILTPSQKLPKNQGDLGKLIVAKSFKNLHKVQYIAQSGHTDDIGHSYSKDPRLRHLRVNWRL